MGICYKTFFRTNVLKFYFPFRLNLIKIVCSWQDFSGACNIKLFTAVIYVVM
jgi:hypothetical protein